MTDWARTILPFHWVSSTCGCTRITRLSPALILCLEPIMVMIIRRRESSISATSRVQVSSVARTATAPIMPARWAGGCRLRKKAAEFMMLAGGPAGAPVNGRRMGPTAAWMSGQARLIPFGIMSPKTNQLLFLTKRRSYEKRFKSDCFFAHFNADCGDCWLDNVSPATYAVTQWGGPLADPLHRYPVGSSRGPSRYPDALLWIRHHLSDDLLRLCGLRWLNGSLTTGVSLRAGGGSAVRNWYHRQHRWYLVWDPAAVGLWSRKD